MNKAELVEAVEKRIGDRKAANDAVETVIDSIVRTVAKGERVAISGFGTFEKVARAARTGRNPRTGDAVRIKKTTVPKFKPGTAFKAFVAAPRSIPSSAATSGAAVTSRGVAAGAAAKKAASKATTAKTAAKTTTAKTTAAKKTATKAAPAKAAATKATTTRAAATKAAPAKKATTAAAKKTTTKRAAAKKA